MTQAEIATKAVRFSNTADHTHIQNSQTTPPQNGQTTPPQKSQTTPPQKSTKHALDDTADQNGLDAGLEDIKKAVGTLPDKSGMTAEERRATAAVCIIRAMSSLAPAASPPHRWRTLILLHNTYYNRLLALLVLLHIALCYREAPPKLYSAPNHVLEANNYWSRDRTFWMDFAICCAYDVHCVLLYRAEWWQGVRNSRNFLLFVVVFLLNVDMVCNGAFESVRPFRCLRPLVYTFSSTQQTIMLMCCLHTFSSVAKIFSLLLTGLLFFTAVGINIFHGSVSPLPPSPNNNTTVVFPNTTETSTNSPSRDFNILGAACWLEANQSHPFGTFPHAFVNMYVLGTTENFPEIIWPFFTCACEVERGGEGVVLSWKTDSHCTYRHVATSLFFVGFLIIVFFCLGNSVLGICYFWYEKIMKHNVILSSLQQRFSLITAFYYLEDSGKVSPDSFIDCVRYMRRVCPGISGSVEGDFLFFQYLDRDHSGHLTLSEFFKVGELMRAQVIVHKGKYRVGLYEKWKNSQSRQRLVWWVEKSVFGASVMELGVVLTIAVDYLLAVTYPSKKSPSEILFSRITTGVLVIEVLIKTSAYGVLGYWADFWNKFDFWIATCSVVGFAIDVSSDSNELHAPVYVLRLVRVLRCLSLLNNSSRSTLSEGSAHKDTFFSKILESFATAVPVCANMMLLVFVYVYFFAMVVMEILGRAEADSKSVPLGWGQVGFRAGQFDWSDAGNALLSVLIINVGNGWNDLMNNAEQAEGTQWVLLLFVVMHFIGVFLLLNIIQSLFVFTFSTFLNHNEFQKTVEYQVQRQLEKLHRVSAASFKQIRRTPRLEFLLLSWDDLDKEYERWLDQQALQTNNRFVDFGTSRLLVAPLDKFFEQIDLTMPGNRSKHDSGKYLSMNRSRHLEEFLRQQIGATQEQAPSKFRRLSTFTEESPRTASGTPMYGRSKSMTSAQPAASSSSKKPKIKPVTTTQDTMHLSVGKTPLRQHSDLTPTSSVEGGLELARHSTEDETRNLVRNASTPSPHQLSPSFTNQSLDGSELPAPAALVLEPQQVAIQDDASDSRSDELSFC